jgi:Tripartite tricarboxylate transporter TctB family
VAFAHHVDGLGAASARRTGMTTPPAMRPSLAVCGSVVTFALLVERAGFLATVMLTVLVASLGSRELGARQAVLLAVAVATAMAIVFIGLLDQPFALGPRL